MTAPSRSLLVVSACTTMMLLAIACSRASADDGADADDPGKGGSDGGGRAVLVLRYLLDEDGTAWSCNNTATPGSLAYEDCCPAGFTAVGVDTDSQVVCLED